MFWRALSLRSKLLFLAMAGLLSFGIFSSTQVMRSIQIRKETLKNEFRSRAELASGGVSASFLERYRDIQSFATNLAFQSQNRDLIIQNLNEYVASYKAYDAIVFVDADGKFVASNSISFDGRPVEIKNLEGRSFSEANWFKKSIKNDYLEDKADGIAGTVVEDVQVDPLTSALFSGTHFGMSFSRAVLATDGRVVGVLTARASLRFIENELRDSFHALQSSGILTGEVSLMNKEGLLLAEISNSNVTARGEFRRNSDKILRWNLSSQQGQMAATEAIEGRSGSLIEVDRVDRIERLWGYNVIQDKRFLEQLGWSVIISASTDEVFSDVLSQRRWFFASFLVLIFVFGLFGYGLSRNISREINDYSSKMRDECLQISEFCDGIDESLRKVSLAQNETSVLAKAISEVSREVFSPQSDGAEILTAATHRLREFQMQSALTDQAVQRVTVEMTLAKTSVEQLSFLDKELQNASLKLQLFNDLIYKIELLSYNSLIESQRAGSHGKGFARIALEIESIVENATVLQRELSEGIQASQVKSLELVGSLRRSVSDSESLIVETRGNMIHFQGEFASLAEGIDGVRTVMAEKENVLRKILESVGQLEGTAGRSNGVLTELRRGVLDVRVQGERLDELIQDFTAIAKGQRARNRGRRGQNAANTSATLNQQLDLPPDQARANVVDRLAQKMRPRLVVKTEDSEPSLSDSDQENSTPRRAG